jgi:hypothetical protein
MEAVSLLGIDDWRSSMLLVDSNLCPMQVKQFM